jgi:hypothetical protein
VDAPGAEGASPVATTGVPQPPQNCNENGRYPDFRSSNEIVSL